MKVENAVTRRSAVRNPDPMNRGLKLKTTNLAVIHSQGLRNPDPMNRGLKLLAFASGMSSGGNLETQPR